MKTKELKTLLELFNTYNLSELDYQENELSIKIKREISTREIDTERVAVEKTCEQVDETTIIRSPIVGTFYRTPSPDSPPYVEIGSTVKKGEVLCTIEAMKIMNQLEADFDCEIVEIYPSQAELVEFDQQLFKVRPL